MFGHRYFGSRYFGNRYFGDGGVDVGGGAEWNDYSNSIVQTQRVGHLIGQS